jgi:hypothetical protein
MNLSRDEIRLIARNFEGAPLRKDGDQKTLLGSIGQGLYYHDARKRDDHFGSTKHTRNPVWVEGVTGTIQDHCRALLDAAEAANVTPLSLLTALYNGNGILGTKAKQQWNDHNKAMQVPTVSQDRWTTRMKPSGRDVCYTKKEVELLHAYTVQVYMERLCVIFGFIEGSDNLLAQLKLIRLEPRGSVSGISKMYLEFLGLYNRLDEATQSANTQNSLMMHVIKSSGAQPDRVSDGILMWERLTNQIATQRVINPEYTDNALMSLVVSNIDVDIKRTTQLLDIGNSNKKKTVSPATRGGTRVRSLTVHEDATDEDLRETIKALQLNLKASQDAANEVRSTTVASAKGSQQKGGEYCKECGIKHTGKCEMISEDGKFNMRKQAEIIANSTNPDEKLKRTLGTDWPRSERFRNCTTVSSQTRELKQLVGEKRKAKQN